VPAALPQFAIKDGALQFDTIVTFAPAAGVQLAVGTGAVDASALFCTLAGKGKQTVKIPLACFVEKGADLARRDAVQRRQRGRLDGGVREYRNRGRRVTRIRRAAARWELRGTDRRPCVGGIVGQGAGDVCARTRIARMREVSDSATSLALDGMAAHFPSRTSLSLIQHVFPFRNSANNP
jgi:hypothetical protein